MNHPSSGITGLVSKRSYREAVDLYLKWAHNQGSAEPEQPTEDKSFAGEAGWVLCHEIDELAFVRDDGVVFPLGRSTWEVDDSETE